MTKTAREMLHNFALTYRVESKESRNQCLDQSLKELEALIRTEKLKLLAEVRERVVGEDEPGVTNIMIAAEHAEQRNVLTQLEAEL